jgi:hypothetical protein
VGGSCVPWLWKVVFGSEEGGIGSRAQDFGVQETKPNEMTRAYPSWR